jgi:hypothetical protein
MTKTEYIAHLRSLGLCKDMAECMAGQATAFFKEITASDAVNKFVSWDRTEEGYMFWSSFYWALHWAEGQDELDLKGLK